MATILIGYDVHPPEGRTHDELVKAIQSLGVWWHHLETIWIVKSAQTPAAIRDRLSQPIADTWAQLHNDPLAVWAEQHFGLTPAPFSLHRRVEGLRSRRRKVGY